MISELIGGVIDLYKQRLKKQQNITRREIKKEELRIEKEEKEKEKAKKEGRPVKPEKGLLGGRVRIDLNGVQIDSKKEQLRKETARQSPKKRSFVQKKMDARKCEAVKKSKRKELLLRTQIIVLTVIKYVVKIIEMFIKFLISVLGVLGFAIVLFVLVLMIVIYGILKIEYVAPSDDVLITDDDCIQGTDVMAQNNYDLSNVGFLQGTMTPYHQALASTASLYSEILSKDLSTVCAKSEQFEQVKNAVGIDATLAFLFGFSAPETGFRFYNDDKDILKYPSEMSKNTAGYAFLGLHYNNIFDGTYKYDGVSSSKVLQDNFVTEWKQKYIPVETPLYDNNYVPYGVATQIGAFSTDYISGRYDDVTESINSVMDAYGITANRDKLSAFCYLFAGASFYHSGYNGVVNENLLSIWCALWSATSDDDSQRNFSNIKIIYDSDTDYSESTARVAFFGKSGKYNLSLNESYSGLSYFSINDEKITVPLWVWLKDNCSNPEYYEKTAMSWFNNLSGSTLILDANYGLLAYLQGTHVLSELGVTTPLASGGSSIDECECVETGSSGNYVGNIDISNIQVGMPQGPWSNDVKTYLMSSGRSRLGYSTASISVLQKYYGQVAAINNPDGPLFGKTNETWRTSTKWQVPFYVQSIENVESGKNNLIPTFASGSGMGAGCHIYMYSYISSALTGTVINPVEMAVAASKTDGFTGPNPYTGLVNAFNDLNLKAVGFRRSSGTIAGDTSDFESYFGLNIDEYKSSESSVLQKVVDTVLSKNGLFGYAAGYDGTHVKFTTLKSNHYVVIAEKVGSEYRVVGYNRNGYSGGTSTGGDLFTWEDIFYSMYAHKNGNEGYNGQRFVAWNPNLRVSSGGSTSVVTNSSTIEIPSNVKQSGLLKDFTNYTYFFSKWAYNQRKVADLWDQKGRQNDKGIATIDGFYLVAAKDKFGQCGDAIQVLLEDGTTINCILGDIKGSDAQSPWGHEYSTGVSLIEWEAFGTADSSTSGVNIELGDWENKKIKSITNLGSYLNGEVSINSVNTRVEFSNILFIGDSYTTGLDSNVDLKGNGHTIFASVGAYPSQFIGSTTKDVTIGDVSGHLVTGKVPSGDFNAVVILLGVNRINQIEDMKTFLKELSGKFSCPIFVQKVFPVGPGYSLNGLTASEMLNNIKVYNDAIKEFCDSNNNLKFIDTTTGLVGSDGYLIKTTEDNLHLSGNDSYTTWFNNIKNVISSYGVSENSQYDVECIEDNNINNVSLGDTSASQTKEERWKFLLGNEYSKYFENSWYSGVTSRGNSSKWLNYIAKFSSSSENSNYIAKVPVKAWDLKDGGWVSYEFDILVHKKLEGTVKAIFEELYALPENERSPIHNYVRDSTMAGISYRHNDACFGLGIRGGGSIHNIGAALDLNPDENPMPGQYGDIANYKPGVDPYSFSDDSKLVKIFEKYGLERGRSYQDYMHFSYLESVDANNSKAGN